MLNEWNRETGLKVSVRFRQQWKDVYLYHRQWHSRKLCYKNGYIGMLSLMVCDLALHSTQTWWSEVEVTLYERLDLCRYFLQEMNERNLACLAMGPSHVIPRSPKLWSWFKELLRMVQGRILYAIALAIATVSNSIGEGHAQWTPSRIFSI